MEHHVLLSAADGGEPFGRTKHLWLKNKGNFDPKLSVTAFPSARVSVL